MWWVHRQPGTPLLVWGNQNRHTQKTSSFYPKPASQSHLIISVRSFGNAERWTREHRVWRSRAHIFIYTASTYLHNTSLHPHIAFLSVPARPETSVRFSCRQNECGQNKSLQIQENVSKTHRTQQLGYLPRSLRFVFAPAVVYPSIVKPIKIPWNSRGTVNNEKQMKLATIEPNQDIFFLSLHYTLCRARWTLFGRFRCMWHLSCHKPARKKN